MKRPTRAHRDFRLDRFLARARARLARLRPRQAEKAIRGGAWLVDIRPEFQRRADGEVPGAIIVERNQLEWRLHPARRGRIPEAKAGTVSWVAVWHEG